MDEDDELLRIIRGFGSDFKRAPSTQVPSSAQEELDGFICCKDLIGNGERPKTAELIIISALGYLETGRGLLLWTHHFIALVLLAAFTSVPTTASVFFATSLMMALYLPLRRGLPAALHEAEQNAEINGSYFELDIWFRGAMLLLLPCLVLVSLGWGFAVGNFARAISGEGRDPGVVASFAKWSVSWLWLEALIDVLRVHLFAKKMRRTRAADMLLFAVLFPLLTLALICRAKLGYRSVPLSLLVTHLVRLAFLVSAACATDSLPSLIVAPLPPGPRYRRMRGIHRDNPNHLQTGALEADNRGSEEDDVRAGDLTSSRAAWLLATKAAAMGLMRTWRSDSPLFILSVLAWSLGDAQMAAHGLLLSAAFVILGAANQPGLARATEKRIRYHIGRAQSAAVAATWRVALSVSSSVAVILSLLCVVCLNGAKLSDDLEGEHAQMWHQMESSSWLVAGFVVCACVLGTLRAYLKATDHGLAAVVGYHGPIALSLVLSFSLAFPIHWSLMGLWMGIFVGYSVALGLCLVMCMLA